MKMKGDVHPPFRFLKGVHFMKIMSMVKKQPFARMFTRKKSNKGFLWVSLISLGASAAVWGMTKGKKTDINRMPIKNMFKNLKINRDMPLMNDAALTEISNELMDKALDPKK